LPFFGKYGRNCCAALARLDFFAMIFTLPQCELTMDFGVAPFRRVNMTGRMNMKLNRRSFLLSVASAGIVLSATGAAFASTPSEDYVHQLGGEVLALARGGHRGDRALQRRFATLLNRYINIPSVANFALGTARQSLPAGDKAKFYDLVSNYAAALFVWYAQDFQGSDLKINSSNDQGKFTIVDSSIVGSGEQLRWRVYGNPGSLRIADINVKGVWLSIAMKKMFEDTLSASRGNFEPLYAKLKEAETW
jgi:phospholipid transport system substrate-binding protein